MEFPAQLIQSPRNWSEMINSRFGRREVVDAKAFRPEDHSGTEARAAVTEAIK